MTSPSTEALAVLAVDSYTDPRQRDAPEALKIDGQVFRVIKHFDEPSGYQGTVYQEESTGALILAHRGTEFDRELAKDGLITDGGMVFLGTNAQAEDAMRATEWAINEAEKLGKGCGDIPLTVTGHSLGGTLAQITAYRYGLRGETFDAYGAAGLITDMKEGGDQVINHVRATDFVSSASKHVGEVRIYAAEKDIQALENAGYENDDRRWTDLRNPVSVVKGVGVEAHYSRNFLKDNDLGIGGSIISEENAVRYDQSKALVDKYRGDIASIHNVLAFPRNAVDAVVDAGRKVATGRDPIEQTAPLRETTCMAPKAVDARDPSHPDHALYSQIDVGMKAVDANLGRSPDGLTERATARLFAEAKVAGLTQADHVLMGTGTTTGDKGPNLFVVQGAMNDPAHLRVSVPSAEAIATPVAQSFELAEAQGKQQAEHEQQRLVKVEQAGPKLAL